MANTKSAIKNVRKTERATLRNKAVRTRLKSLAKQVAATRASGDAAQAAATARAYISALDKASKSNVLHPNAVARRKARLSAVIGGGATAG